MIYIKNKTEIETMRESGRIAAGAIDAVVNLLQDGITTEEIDNEVEKYIKKAKAIPAFKGYKGFPKCITISLNEEVVHGIPGKRRIKAGDLVSIDLGAVWKGFYSDVATTVAVGKVGPDKEKLINVTREALNLGISKAKEGFTIGDIAYAVQTYVEAQGFSVVRALAGHGIGRNLHEEPEVPNYGKPGFGLKLQEGMVLAIEPMVNVGNYEVMTRKDNWTVITMDGSCSAHFEHTVAVTDNGPQILTVL
jgi:methionyl aminopeptidase